MADSESFIHLCRVDEFPLLLVLTFPNCILLLLYLHYCIVVTCSNEGTEAWLAA